MDSTPTLLRRPPFPSPPPPPQPAHSVIFDSSPFLPILYLFAFIGIIGLIYAFFFSIKWNTRLRRSSSGVVGGSTHLSINTSDSDKLVSSVVYEKEAHGGGDCPVCLTAFMDGEAIREVNVCKHLFHGGCIDTWLCSHSNCPVCRAFIGTRRPKPAVAMGGEDDLRRGLPDSATLV